MHVEDRINSDPAFHLAVQVLVRQLIARRNRNVSGRVPQIFFNDLFINLFSFRAVRAPELRQALREATLNIRILRGERRGLPEKRERFLQFAYFT